MQTSTPDELWAGPVDEDVARFLGLGNVGEGSVVRPEAVRVVLADGGPGDGVVESAARLGSTVRVRILLDNGRRLEAAVASLEHPRPGARVAVTVDPAGIINLP